MSKISLESIKSAGVYTIPTAGNYSPVDPPEIITFYINKQIATTLYPSILFYLQYAPIFLYCPNDTKGDIELKKMYISSVSELNKIYKNVFNVDIPDVSYPIEQNKLFAFNSETLSEAPNVNFSITSEYNICSSFN